MQWLDRTGQTWKLWMFAMAFAMAFTAFLAFLAPAESARLLADLGLGFTVSDERDVLKAVLFVVLGLVALVWLALSIRCPECGAHVAWRIANRADAEVWFMELMLLAHCPYCGDAARKGHPTLDQHVGV